MRHTDLSSSLEAKGQRRFTEKVLGAWLLPRQVSDGKAFCLKQGLSTEPRPSALEGGADFVPVLTVYRGLP